MTSAPPSDLERLAQLAYARRRKLGLTVTAITAKVGLSKDTYARIEKAEPITASSYARAEIALEWAAGSARAVLDGGEPTLARPGRIPGQIDAVDLGQALTSAIVAVTDRLTAAQVRKISRLTVEELARRGIAGRLPDEGGDT